MRCPHLDRQFATRQLHLQPRTSGDRARVGDCATTRVEHDRIAALQDARRIEVTQGLHELLQLHPVLRQALPRGTTQAMCAIVCRGPPWVAQTAQRIGALHEQGEACLGLLPGL